MCRDCGCSLGGGAPHAAVQAVPDAATVLGGLLAENDRQAEHNRARLDAEGVLAVNLMSSPGSGKTALLEATLRSLSPALRIGVIEGDLETENDAERIRALGAPAFQITTGTACHLDAGMVARALDALPLERLDLLFIENVGNLVCPASFDLGHHRNVTLLSVTEGDDKPAKYPVMFRAADAVLLTKLDLLAVLDDFAPQRAERCLRRLASEAPMLGVSARGGEGLAAWYDWLRAARQTHHRALAAGQRLHPGPAAAASRPAATRVVFRPLDAPA